MWIEVSDGAKTRWVLANNCFNEQGIVSSSVLSLAHVPTPHPDWFDSPERSVLRNSMQWGSLLECRSKDSTIPAILDFYKGRVQAGGLKIVEPAQFNVPTGMSPPRQGAGFRAENNDYRFRIDAFEHGKTVFWTVQHGPTVRAPRLPRRPAKLRLLEIEGEHVNLVDDDSGRKYSTRLGSLMDSRPEPANVSFAPRQIPWSSLPEWVQFGASPTAIGELRDDPDTGIPTRWWANRTWYFREDPEAMFVSALQRLDDSGFDRTGEHNADRSYFVSILQGGASLNLHARSERGDKAILTVLDTLGHMSLNITYEPPSGTVPPTTIRTPR